MIMQQLPPSVESNAKVTHIVQRELMYLLDQAFVCASGLHF